MNVYKLERMREVYETFPMELKEALSTVRIFEYSDLSKIDKEHKKGLSKEYNLALKVKNQQLKKILSTLTSKDRSCCKQASDDFGYEIDILLYDLENADNQIELAKDEISLIKSEFNDLSRGKRKEATRKLERLKAKVVVYAISREKIKTYYDAVSNNPKFALKAIKIRNLYDKKQAGKIRSIDNQIAKLTKVVNAAPKTKNA